MQNRIKLPRIPTPRSSLSSREMTSIQRDVRTKPLSKPGASERGRRRIKLCAPYFMGHQVDGSEDNLYTAIATVWQLLAIDEPRMAARVALQHFVQSLSCRPLAVMFWVATTVKSFPASWWLVRRRHKDIGSHMMLVGPPFSLLARCLLVTILSARHARLIKSLSIAFVSVFLSCYCEQCEGTPRPPPNRPNAFPLSGAFSPSLSIHLFTTNLRIKSRYAIQAYHLPQHTDKQID
jgi:hypothetical protein